MAVYGEPVSPMNQAGLQRPVVYLHIGGPKTGTTYLQEVLWRNRMALRDGGVLYPGSRPDAHFRAAQDLLGQSFNNHADPEVPGTWQGLVDEAKRHEGTSVVSHELLGLASEEDVDRALRSLAFAEVHVLYTARDLARQIPSVWQEDIKNGHVLRFEEFIKGLRGDEAVPHGLVDLFWRYQNLARVLATWSRNLAADRVHVVTVPPRGRAAGLLWERFAHTIGIEADTGAADTPVTNRSLGIVEAGLLRHVNLRLGSDLDWPTYNAFVKGGIVGALVETSTGSVPITLPASEHGWVAEWSKQSMTDLGQAGYDVVGDLAELLPDRSPADSSSRHPDDASEAEQLDAATDAMVGLARSLRETRVRAMRRNPPPEPDAMTLIRRGIAKLSEQSRSVMVLRRLYRLVMRCVRRLDSE